MSGKLHVPIMVDQVLECLEGAYLETFFDGTLGAGGHAQAILEAHPEIVRYIGCDKDPEALLIAQENLAPFRHKMEFVQGDFSNLDTHLAQRGFSSVDGFFLIWECLPCN